MYSLPYNFILFYQSTTDIIRYYIAHWNVAMPKFSALIANEQQIYSILFVIYFDFSFNLFTTEYHFYDVSIIVLDNIHLQLCCKHHCVYNIYIYCGPVLCPN